MKVVQFKDGTYGVRRRFLFFFFQYRDLRDPEYWWSASSKYFRSDCRTKDYQLALSFAKPDYGKVIV